MTKNSELHLIITGDGKQLRSSLGQSERDVRGYVSRSKRMFGDLHGSIGRGLKGALVNPFTMIGGAAGVLAIGKQIIDFDASLKRLAINGSLSDEEMVKLRSSIVDVGIASGQSREDVLSGINAIIERTGNTKFAVASMETIAKAATATGASMQDMGALASNLNEKMGITSEGLAQAFNVLAVQGKAGAFTLENLAQLGERLFSAYGNLGGKGVEGIRAFGALVQTARMSTGSSEMATTAIENVLNGIIEKQQVLSKMGVDIYADRSIKKYKAIDVIIKEIITKTKGDTFFLQKIFGTEGLRGVSTLANLYRETKGFALYDQLVGADAQRAGELMKDFARYSTTASFKFQVLGELGKKFADSALSKPIDELTEALDRLMSNPEKLKEFEQTIEDIGSIIGEVAGGFALLLSQISQLTEVVPAAKKAGEEGLKRNEIDKTWSKIPGEDRRSLEKQLNFRENRYVQKQRLIEKYQTENRINLTVNIDKDGRISTRSDSLNTHVAASLNRGSHTASQ
jgi:TP901 family phage tail tape measure protein